MSTVISNRTYNSGRPKAYLNYLYLDEDFNIYASGAEQIPYSDAGTGAQTITIRPVANQVQKHGYLYVFLSNESAIDVFFDNLVVNHERGPVLEESHYYPFGLVMQGISSKAANTLQNRYKYNGGNELQSAEFSDGNGLEMYDAVNRMYEPQIGRFWRVDELAESNWEWSPYFFANNNPILFNDPFGLDPETSTAEKPKQLQEIVIISTKKMSFWAKMNLMYDLQKRTGNDFSRIECPHLRYEMERLRDIADFRQRVADMTREGDKVALEVGSWLVPVGALTKIRYLKYAERLFNFKRGRIFWSGGSEVAGATAKAYAKLFGGHTLEMTLKGKYLEILTKVKGYEVVKPLWEKASREFAKGAEGVVKVFHNATEGVSVTSTWVREEYKF